ncbi:hypothetical protein QF030_000424 [Streptomyces rishiriensis]|uniref:Uncharacterized protein n=1 Tax=Streptomyces rishiriensis TaxID=68264 RepID=A0ABU0NGN1_STRRH|nr:hypothetical protein [Streptomyces rishiriensis]
MIDYPQFIMEFEFERDSQNRPLIPGRTRDSGLSQILLAARVDDQGRARRTLDEERANALAQRSFSVVRYGTQYALARETRTEGEFRRDGQDIAVAAIVRDYEFETDRHGRPILPAQSVIINNIKFGEILHRTRAIGGSRPAGELGPATAQALKSKRFDVWDNVGGARALSPHTPTNATQVTHAVGPASSSLSGSRPSASAGTAPSGPSSSQSAPIVPAQKSRPAPTPGAGPSGHAPASRSAPTAPAIATGRSAMPNRAELTAEALRLLKGYIQQYKIEPIAASVFSKNNGKSSNYLRDQKTENTGAWNELTPREQLEFHVMSSLNGGHLMSAERVAAEVKRLEQRVEGVEAGVHEISRMMYGPVASIPDLRPQLMSPRVPYGSIEQHRAAERAAAAALAAAEPVPGQPVPGQPVPGQPVPGQPVAAPRRR